MVRKRIGWIAALGVLAATAASADGRPGLTDYAYARVVDVEPMVRYVTVERPREECWEDVVYEPERPTRVAGPAIAGGLIGGAIGRQFGGGSGRDALTLAGAIAGSAIASERAARNRERGAMRARTVERCEIVSERFTEERVDGYRVTYQYRGRRDTIVMREPPGERIRLRVSAVPVGHRR